MEVTSHVSSHFNSAYIQLSLWVAIVAPVAHLLSQSRDSATVTTARRDPYHREQENHVGIPPADIPP